MALLTKGTWVVVMDQEHAILYENDGTVDAPALRELERMQAEPLAPYSDRPGRVYDNGKEQRSAMEQPDVERLAGERLAARVVEHLRKVAGAHPLVIAAPPQLLGVVRAELDRQGSTSGPNRLHVVCTVPKTLTGIAPAKLSPILTTALEAV
jgi:protein required for attachment to host cells